MKSSQSEIQQSIQYSRTHQLKLPDESRRGDVKMMVNENERPFIHYYEENIQLKKKQNEMAKEMAAMKKQLSEQAQINRQNKERELKMLATGKKSLWDTKNMSAPGSYKQKLPKKEDSRKVESLLEIIDHYKTKMLRAEQEIENLKRQKHLLEQDGKVKDRKADQIMKTFQQSSRPGNQETIQEQLRSAVNNLQIEKQRNKFSQAEIRRLESRIKTLVVNEQEFENLRQQNRNLEDKIMRLTSLTSFGNVVEKADEEHKVKQLQRKLKGLNQKFSQIRNENIKYEAENKLLKTKLIEAHSECDQLEKMNEKLKKQSIDNPVLSKLATNPDLLAKVVYEIEYGPSNGKSQFLDSSLERQSYDRILLEKEMLAKELGSLRIQIEAMKDNWKEKERLAKIEKQQLVVMYKDQQNIAKTEGGKQISKNGVPYSDDVSMFSQDSGSVPPNSNYFDLFLGDLHLLQTMMKTVFGIHNADSCLVMATVDFYNHNTENTKPVHGAHANLQSQFSFKITQDEFFFRYINKGQFYVDVWGSEGSKRHNFGRAVVDLRPVIIKSRRNVAPVVSASAPVYLNQRVMGSINLVMRMRLPIYDQLEKLSEIGQMIETDEDAVTRRLIIQIQEGKGFQQSANTFVYYPFRLEDYYTKTYRGSNPAWNHHKSIQLKYNNDLKNYLRKNELQLVVLDDNAVNVHNNDGSDVVGLGYVSLIPLLENKTIKERVQVVKGAHKTGYVDIKIFWHDTQESKQQVIQEKDAETFMNELQEDINKFLREHRMDADDVFKMIDGNKTGMISFAQFHPWVMRVAPTAKMETVNKFYNSIKQPVNMINFASRLNQKPTVGPQIAKQLSMINKLVNQNTTLLVDKKQSLGEFLKGKDIIEVSLQIDKSRNGRIERAELQEYFDLHNIDEQIKEDVVDIVRFLKRYKQYT